MTFIPHYQGPKDKTYVTLTHDITNNDGVFTKGHIFRVITHSERRDEDNHYSVYLQDDDGYELTVKDHGSFKPYDPDAE